MKATFFLRGDHLADFPEVAQEAQRQGHRLEPHCWEHRSHSSMSEAEIAQDLDRVLGAFRELLGIDAPAFWRPPNGSIKRPDTYDVAARRRLKIVTWTLETCDWAGYSAERMWGEITSEARPAAALRPDSIVLMHDPMGEETAKLTERLIAEIHGRGWSTGPIPPDAQTPEEPFMQCR